MSKVTATVVMFQHTAARRRLGKPYDLMFDLYVFQHTAARRRLAMVMVESISCPLFQHTAARRRLGQILFTHWTVVFVSTHSRPKAAGRRRETAAYIYASFNTQPPEGGWDTIIKILCQNGSFNTQPPEGGWFCYRLRFAVPFWFQHTAARRRLGDFIRSSMAFSRSFNTQPPEGGWLFNYRPLRRITSFNTQPPEGGWLVEAMMVQAFFMFQHTAARRRLVLVIAGSTIKQRFQHTAARRRLEPLSKALLHQVSQPRFR